jgi:hypothetical protein
MCAQAFAVLKADTVQTESEWDLDITLRPAIAGQSE